MHPLLNIKVISFYYLFFLYHILRSYSLTQADHFFFEAFLLTFQNLEVLIVFDVAMSDIMKLLLFDYQLNPIKLIFLIIVLYYSMNHLYLKFLTFLIHLIVFNVLMFLSISLLLLFLFLNLISFAFENLPHFRVLSLCI